MPPQFHSLTISDIRRFGDFAVSLRFDVPPALADIPNLRELWLNHNKFMRGETPAVLTNKGLQVLVR